MSWPSIVMRPAGRVVEAEQQPREGRLAGARRADHREARARRDVEVDALQDLALRIVAEADVLEPDMAALRPQAPARRPVDDLGGRVEQVEHRLHVDQALADRAVDPAEHVQRPEQLHQQRIDQHHVAGRELALAPAPDGEDHRAAHHHVGDQRLADVEPGERGLVLHRGAR